MPSRPSIPQFKPLEKAPSPRMRSKIFTAEAVGQKRQAKRRKGYMSTVLTEPGKLGQLNLEKNKALGV